MQRTITNPILPGLYPDPSICRAGDDFYLVNSSFELYPGIPVFHSRNLVDWEQIGHVMTKDNGFHVTPNCMAGGVMAPTIRYHNGTFYLINANFGDRGNFLVTTDDPRHGWSEPRWFDDIPGIDASLFFEGGKTYLLCTGMIVNPQGIEERGISLCEYDLEHMHMVGEPHPIWNSALRVTTSPEAPHLYKRGEYYYLVIAEGGTEFFHAVTVARSKDLFGWYEACPANPVLTHRDMGHGAAFTNVGHADLVDTPWGDWYAVALGSRTVDGYYKNFGRETFMCPVSWEDDWPVFAPGVARMEPSFSVEVPEDRADSALERAPVRGDIICDFNADALPVECVLWGTPYDDVCRVGGGELSLKCCARRIDEPLRFSLDREANQSREDSVGFVGVRERTVDFSAETVMRFDPEGVQTAGLALLQACNFQYRVEMTNVDGGKVLRLVVTTTDMAMPPFIPAFTSETHDEILAETPCLEGDVRIRVEAEGQRYRFFVGSADGEPAQLGEDCDARLINPTCISALSGVLVGMFASGNGTASDNRAVFTEFAYRER